MSDQDGDLHGVEEGAEPVDIVGGAAGAVGGAGQNAQLPHVQLFLDGVAVPQVVAPAPDDDEESGVGTQASSSGAPSCPIVYARFANSHSRDSSGRGDGREGWSGESPSNMPEPQVLARAERGRGIERGRRGGRRLSRRPAARVPSQGSLHHGDGALRRLEDGVVVAGAEASSTDSYNSNEARIRNRRGGVWRGVGDRIPPSVRRDQERREEKKRYVHSHGFRIGRFGGFVPDLA